MTDTKHTASQERSGTRDASSWGAWLFFGTLLAILLFFWWLLIHSGGVAGHGG